MHSTRLHAERLRARLGESVAQHRIDRVKCSRKSDAVERLHQNGQEWVQLSFSVMCSVILSTLRASPPSCVRSEGANLKLSRDWNIKLAIVC
jgi:hypothetical protein